jgi:hypothetical protein
MQLSRSGQLVIVIVFVFSLVVFGVVLWLTTSRFQASTKPPLTSVASIRTSKVKSIKEVVTADVGDMLCIPGFAISTIGAVVVATSDTCPFCRQSKDTLFANLVSSATDRSIPVVFLRERSNDASSTVPPNAKELPVTPSDVGIFYFPTIAVVNSSGVIRKIVHGFVQPERHGSAIAGLFRLDNTLSEPLNGISGSDLSARLSRGEKATLLDVSGKSVPTAPYIGRQETVHIPVGELHLRAKYELQPQELTVVDCRPVGGFLCQQALLVLRSNGFKKSAGLDLPRLRKSPSCPG